MGGGEAILAAGQAGAKRCKGECEQGSPEGCEGGKVEARGQSTEDGGRKDAKTVQRWKSAYGRCKGGKVESEYGVQITEEQGHKKVGAWQDRLRSTEYGVRSAGGAHERQRAPTGSDTFRMPNEVRPHGALGWYAVPTLPEAERNGEPGSGILEGRRTDVA